MTVFYTDDDAEDRILFEEAVAEVRSDVTVVSARDGAEAIEKLEGLSRLPQLIFMDINMPGMSGELPKDLRRGILPVLSL